MGDVLKATSLLLSLAAASWTSDVLNYDESLKQYKDQLYLQLNDSATASLLYNNQSMALLDDKLLNNIDTISLDKLRDKRIYLTINRCVDGREDESGVTSFGGAAGSLIAAYLAVKEQITQWDEQKAIDVLTQLVGDIKIYLHDDTHAEHDNHGKHPCDCHHIGCGAVDRMLKEPKDGSLDLNVYGLTQKDRELLWKFLKEHSTIKVLQWDHEEQSIERITDAVVIDESGRQELAMLKHNKKNISGQETQDFVYNETGRDLVLGYIAEDIVEQQWFSGETKNTMTSSLKARIIAIADDHMNRILPDLPPAKKCVDEGNVIKFSFDSAKSYHVLP